MSSVVAPPYDQIGPETQARLYEMSPWNIVRLTLPRDGYAAARATLDAWRASGVFEREPEPAIYPYHQSYLVDGAPVTRRGFIALGEVTEYTEKIVRPHERTHAGPKEDRMRLLEATEADIGLIFMLMEDPEGALGRATAPAGPPLVEVQDLRGETHRLWRVTDTATIGRVEALMADRLVIIADGHHRYETAVAYASEDPRADRVLALIVSTADPGLTILATHRIIVGGGRDPTKLVVRWREWFEVGRVAPCMDRVERLAELGRDRTACIVAFPDGYDVTLVLKPDAPLDAVAELGTSPAVRALDVARIEALVVQYILGAGAATPSLAYTPDAQVALDAVRLRGAAAAVLLNPTKVEQVLAVADAGGVMPPKSTYFVPKVPAGLVLRPLGG